MAMAASESRTQWAERKVEEFLAAPFISEFVFRSPQHLDGTQKEVADLLILHKGAGLLLSQKAQDDPLSRTEQKNELWVLKASKEWREPAHRSVAALNQADLVRASAAGPGQTHLKIN